MVVLPFSLPARPVLPRWRGEVQAAVNDSTDVQQAFAKPHQPLNEWVVRQRWGFGGLGNWCYLVQKCS